MADSPASTSTAKSASETRNTRQSPVQSKASSGSTISAATPRRSALRSDAGNGTPSSTSRGAQSSAPFIAPRFSGSNKSSPAQSSGRTSVGLRQRATSIRTKAAKEDAGAATISARENAENAPASSSASVSSQHGGSSITNDGATLTNIGHVDQEALRRVGVLPLWENALKLSEEDKAKHVIWLDIDNTLYRKSSRIAELMAQRIRAYFLTLGLDESEAERLHKHYYSSYGLAIKGLVRHHKIDPLDYDAKCDASLPLDDILKPDAEIQQLLADVDRTKTRIWALTNAYKTHAVRVLKLLGLYEYIEGAIYCDYAVDSFVSKPDREYYDAALAHVGTTAEQSFFVDDSALNIRAAQDLGWRSCVLFSEVDEEPVELESVQSSSTLTTFNTGILLPKAVPNGNVAQDKTARGGHFDEELLKSQFRSLPHQHRVRLVSILFSAAEPADLVVLSRLLDRHLRLSRDMISSLPDRIITSIFEKLEVRELLRCRQVSKKWLEIAAMPELWRSHAIALTEADPTPVIPPDEPAGWEPLVRALYWRERNWARGIAQRVDLFEGHTGFVTAVKRKGQTLVTGSYDQTVRIWDLTTGNCTRILQAKAIACLDFLPGAILCAGLYDTGRIMVWDMRTWELLHTLTGHNRGIRNLALNARHLVTVGQDKAVICWDWRTGEKVIRWGQQSNVSLGVSIVDDDKIVACTVDAIVRTFSIKRQQMIGQFHISKLGGDDKALSAELAGLGGDANMLQWFAAHRRTITVASRDSVVHLEWSEHIEPLAEEESPRSTPIRSRKDSTQSTAGGRPSTSLSNLSRSRRDSTASNASDATTATSAPIRRASGAPASRSPGVARSPSVLQPLSRAGSIGTPSRPAPTSSSDKRRSLNKTVSPMPWPTPPGASSKAGFPASPSLPAFPSSTSALETRDDIQGEAKRTRIAPNLTVAPRVIDIVRMPDGATGCVDPGKRRVVSACRFSSRAGSDRRIFATTLRLEGRKEDEEQGGGRAVVPLGGAWQEQADLLAQPPANPMSIILDHESCVVGTSSGLIYRVSFVGNAYTQGWVEADSSNGKADTAIPQRGIGDTTITDLVQLRDIWSTLMLPEDSPADHPGRFKPRRDLVAAMGLR